jgi:acetyl/propionyl-CoA carboxylase alpha subunit
MQHEAFRSGNFDTHFVGKYFTPDKLQHVDENEAKAAAYVMARIMEEAKTKAWSPVAENTTSNWKKNRTN